MAVRTPPGKAPISAVRTDHEFYFMLAGCTTRILCFFSLAANHQDGIAQDGVRTTHMDTLHMATMERSSSMCTDAPIVGESTYSAQLAWQSFPNVVHQTLLCTWLVKRTGSPQTQTNWPHVKPVPILLEVKQ